MFPVSEAFLFTGEGVADNGPCELAVRQGIAFRTLSSPRIAPAAPCAGLLTARCSTPLISCPTTMCRPP